MKRIVCMAIAATFLAGSAVGQDEVPAAYVRGDLKSLREKKPGTLRIDPEGALVFDCDGARWSIPSGQVRTIYISLSRRSVLVEVPYAWPAAIGKDRKLLLSLRLETEKDRFRRAVFYLPAGASKGFLDRLRKESGAGLVFESEEARREIEN